MFTDLDAVENMIGKSVEQMDANELVTYVKTWTRAVYDLDLPATAHRERSIFSGLKRTYGNRAAGQIVKWPFWKYDGLRNGEHITYGMFSKGMKWLTDMWYLEMQEHVRREAKKDTVFSGGFAKLQDI